MVVVCVLAQLQEEGYDRFVDLPEAIQVRNPLDSDICDFAD